MTSKKGFMADFLLLCVVPERIQLDSINLFCFCFVVR